MVKVGITGGIGSGKSLVCHMFSLFGIPVYHADDRAKDLMNESETIKNSLLNRYGTEVYKSGLLNRKMLAEIIFNNKAEINFVNNLVHPAVGDDFLHWCNEHESEKIVLKEAALLFESGIYRELDVLISVSCPEEIRIARVMQRDGVTREKVVERIANQWSEEEKTKLSDYIIINDDKHSLIQQVNSIYKELITK